MKRSRGTRAVIVEVPEILNPVKGETLGQKMENIALCMNTIAFMIDKLHTELTRGTIIVDGLKHQIQRGIINEHYERWEDYFIAVLETGIGDWIRGALLWKIFEKSGAEAHTAMIRLIKEEHARRDLGVDDEDDSRVTDG